MHIDRYLFINQTKFISPVWHYTTGAFSLLCLLCGLLSNGLVIFVFLKNNNLRRPTNYLLINLAITDLGLLLTNNTFHVIASFNQQWPFGQTGCNLYAFCGGLFGLTSIATMMAISLTRLSAVINPFSSLKLTGNFVIKCIVFSWLYGSIWMIPPLIGWNRFIFEGLGTTCTFDYMSKNIWDRLYVMVLVTGGFLIPLLIIITSYTFILNRLSKRGRHIMEQNDQNHELELRQQNLFRAHSTNSYNGVNSRSESTPECNQNNLINGNLHRTEARVTCVALLVCMIYCTAWGPYALMVILSQIGCHHFVTAYSTAMLGLFTKTAACINPLIYALSSSRFQRQMCLSMKRILPCRRRSQPSSSSNSDLNRKSLNVRINQRFSISD